MGLTGKMVDQIEIKAVGDLFHESMKYRPHSIDAMSPEKVVGFELHEGHLGTAGCCISWHYTHDGKRRVAKQMIEAVDEENKSIVFKMIEGDLMDLYKSFILTYHVDDKQSEKHIVTWTFEYEKLNENIPDPTTLMQLILEVTKDIANHHLLTPTQSQSQVPP